MVIPMLKIRRPTGRLIFNMGIPIPGKTVFYIETGPCSLVSISEFFNHSHCGLITPYCINKPSHHCINSSAPGQNGSHFADNILRCIFLNEKFYLYFDEFPKRSFDVFFDHCNVGSKFQCHLKLHKVFNHIEPFKHVCQIKVDQHAGGKWLIHDTKHRKDNQLQSLKLPCRISKLGS